MSELKLSAVKEKYCTTTEAKSAHSRQEESRDLGLEEAPEVLIGKN